MTRDRFQDILDSNGSHLSRWPGAERLAAERLIASDRAAAKAFERARDLDRMIEGGLGKGVAESDDAAIAARILARLDEKLPAQMPSATVERNASVRTSRSFWAFLMEEGALAPRLAALSFAAALGVTLGLFWAQAMPGHTTEEASADVTTILFQPGNAIGTFQ